MTRGVVYMLTGTKHAVQLTVSVHCLRESGWSGRVAILAGCEGSQEVADKISVAADVEVVKWTAPRGPRGTQYANKTLLGELSPFDESVFLDADTLPVGDFSSVFPTEDEVRITQFVNWVTTGKRLLGRIAEWSEVAATEVARMSCNPYPAINTGVIGFSRRCDKFMTAWRQLCLKNVRFICDEIACQLIFPDHAHVLLDQRWNCSPIYGHEAASEMMDVRIWHGHGWKFIKKQAGRDVWLPWYESAIEGNFARLAEWTPGTDRKLKSYLNGDKYQ